MNCPSRTEEPPEDYGWNQNPRTLSADLTTRQDLNGMINLRAQRTLDPLDRTGSDELEDSIHQAQLHDRPRCLPPSLGPHGKTPPTRGEGPHSLRRGQPLPESPIPPPRGYSSKALSKAQHLWGSVVKFATFIGPGFMVSVAYIDPGNYSTDVAAGAAKKFRLLFIVFMSNVFAILLQSLAVRLGTVTGLNLAENCRAHLPRWLNYVLYFLGEGAIIATDIAEVSILSSGLATCLMLIPRIGHRLSHSPELTP